MFNDFGLLWSANLALASFMHMPELLINNVLFMQDLIQGRSFARFDP